MTSHWHLVGDTDRLLLFITVTRQKLHFACLFHMNRFANEMTSFQFFLSSPHDIPGHTDMHQPGVVARAAQEPDPAKLALQSQPTHF